MTKICIPIIEPTNELVLQKINAAKKAGADLVELWLGEIDEPDVKTIISDSSLPVIINCKGEDEQGNFSGTVAEKKELLLEGIKAGATYLDIGFCNPPELIRELFANKQDAKVILSLHYFRGTPGLPRLTADVDRMTSLSPDIIKIAALPRNLKDVVTMIRLAEKLSSKEIPHILISMGKLGKITRIASPVLQNEIMFAPLDQGSISAPGQISINELHKIYKIL
jgi:3-dehydroquinate dehydratase-1